jgi:hypothetical protein
LHGTGYAAGSGGTLGVPASFTKRQGVSGESSDPKNRANDHQSAVAVTRFEKDFRLDRYLIILF